MFVRLHGGLKPAPHAHNVPHVPDVPACPAHLTYPLNPLPR